MRPTSKFALLVLVGDSGCAGASNSSTPVPSGGGGTVADYVGTYTGSFYATRSGTSSAGASLLEGTANLTVAPDGTVTGSRRLVAGTLDETLTGTITADGTLQLRRSTDLGPAATFVGSMGRRGARAVAALTAFDSRSNGDFWQLYRFTTSFALDSAMPRNTGMGIADLAPRFVGQWSGTDDTSAFGALSLTVAKSGRTTGKWSDLALGEGVIRGSLLSNEGSAQRTTGSGRLDIVFANGARRRLDVRIVFPAVDLALGPIGFVGSAINVDDGSEFGIDVAPAP